LFKINRIAYKKRKQSAPPLSKVYPKTQTLCWIETCCKKIETNTLSISTKEQMKMYQKLLKAVYAIAPTIQILM